MICFNLGQDGASDALIINDDHPPRPFPLGFTFILSFFRLLLSFSSFVVVAHHSQRNRLLPVFLLLSQGLSPESLTPHHEPPLEREAWSHHHRIFSLARCRYIHHSILVTVDPDPRSI